MGTLWLCFLLVVLYSEISLANVKHLEPLENFEVLHLGTHLQSLQANSQPNERGRVQPYPDELHVKFQAFGKESRFDVSIDEHHLAKDAKLMIMEGDSIVSEQPLELTSYRGVTDDGWISLTITPDRLVHAVASVDGELLHIDPLRMHKNALHSAHYSLLENQATSQLVAFRFDDVETENLHCGSVDAEMKAPTDADVVQESPDKRRLLQLVPFVNCFPNQKLGANMSLSYGIDYGFQRNFTVNGVPSATAASAFVVATVANMNSIYYAQMNVWLALKTIVAQTSSSTTIWNYDRNKGNCPNISYALSNFSSWRQNNSDNPNYQSGSWLLATDCYTPGGNMGSTVGLAWIGGLCRKYYGSGVTSFSHPWYLITSHELGHNFGSGHSFQEGVGTTGGIMDYGDGTYLGVDQFHPVYTQDAICKHLTKQMSATTCGSDCIPQAMCWSTFKPYCGNGVVEPGEQCDDGSNNGATTSCCTSTCVNKAGIECTTGDCCLNCYFATTNTSCDAGPGVGSGYCSPGGVCKQTTCNFYGMKYCGTNDTNPCLMLCEDPFKKVCSNMAGWTDSTSHIPFNMNATNGSYCRSNPRATCQSAVCVDLPVSYMWVASSFSSCSVTCGNGTQTSVVYCRDQSNVVVNDSYCSTNGTKPPTSQPCTNDVCRVYSWKTNDDNIAWSQCTKDCGGGWQTRPTPMCSEQAAPTVAVLESFCGTPPATNRTCNTQACPADWSVVSWGACSAQCGGGTQNPTVVCVQTQNTLQTVVADAMCNTTRPAAQSCNTETCATAIWVYSTWSECTKSCGGGTQTRVSECRDSSSNQVTTGCSGSPVVSQTCNTNTCPNYRWTTTSFNYCTASCGGGIQNRNVSCTDANNGSTVVPDYLCTATKPIRIQTCSAASCPNYQWVTTAWSSCSATCGNGTATRTVQCMDIALNVDATGKCTGTAPFTSISCSSSCTSTPQLCDENSCPGFWYASAWSQCSATCGGGWYTRTLQCLDRGTKDPLDASQCSGTTPSTVARCNAFACPVWKPSAFGSCSVPCGDGTMTRTIACYDPMTAAFVSNARCTGNVPPTSAPCRVMPCPTWVPTTWTNCSSPCGGGTQTRQVVCRTPKDYQNGVQVSDASLCPSVKPPTQQACAIDPCPRYYYNVTWGSCSASCGDGTQTGTVQCVGPSGVASNGNCVGPTPNNSQTCNLKPCQVPGWVPISDWTNCTGVCINGTQTRQFACMDTTANTLLTSSVCSGISYNNTQQCTAAVTCMNGGQCTNSTSANFCKCTPGGHGGDCSITPVIANVTVDFKQFASQGIPSGENVLISWATIGNMPYVNIFLVKQSWKHPQYIASQVLNDNQTTATNRSYLWTLTSALPVGNDYSLMIYYSPDVYDIYPDTGYFSIASPCAYVTCGPGGVCNSTTGACACPPGYSGTRCELTPCAQKRCSVTTSNCSNTGSNPGQCVCLSGWSGPLCDTPSGCTSFVCQNGGIVNKPANPSLCTTLTCTCQNFFFGKNCQNCALTCKNGIPDSACLNCNCGPNSGWTGRDCSCRYYILSVHVRNTRVRNSVNASWVNDSIALASFKDGFAREVAATLGISTSRVNATVVRADGKYNDSVEVIFYLTQDCVDTSAFSASGTAAAAPYPTIDIDALDSFPRVPYRLFAVNGTDPTLNALAASLEGNFSDPDSPASRGFFLGGILVSEGMTLIPVTPFVTAPSSSSSSTTSSRSSSSTTSSSSSSGGTSSSSFLTSTPSRALLFLSFASWMVLFGTVF